MSHLRAQAIGLPNLSDGDQPAHSVTPGDQRRPPESWEQGPDLIVNDRLVDTQLIDLIERSRQADRDEIETKQLICQKLGIRTTALKGNGFVAYLPDMDAFAAAIEDVENPAQDGQALGSKWEFHVAGQHVLDTLQQEGAEVTDREPVSYLFIPLQAA